MTDWLKKLITFCVVGFFIGTGFVYFGNNSDNFLNVNGKEKIVQQQNVRSQEDRINKISQSGAFCFDLEPFQQLDGWWYVDEGLSYRISASKETWHPYYVKYKRGDLVKMDREEVKLPDRAGAFKFIACEKRVKLTLLVTKKK